MRTQSAVSGDTQQPQEQPFAWTGTYDERVRAAYHLIANHVYGRNGDFAYRAFEHINASYFAGRLPEPLIVWDLTSWGGCLGWTRSSEQGPPVIKLHPSLISPATDRRGNRPREVWRIPQELLGHCYAYHVLLHECLHAGVNYLLGGIESHPDRKSYWTSHNNPLWVAEVNRVARLTGLDLTFQMKSYRRIDAEPSKDGRKRRKLVYTTDGPDFERFPHDTPGAREFYLRGQLPFVWESPPPADESRS
jgi:hypothetical protein